MGNKYLKMDLSSIDNGLLKEKALKFSKGRKINNPSGDSGDNDLGFGTNPFVLDQEKISNSKALRSLGDKTQVFTGPLNKLVRNRLTHSLEVAALAVTLSNKLGLNSELVRAIALGHDTGHVPFGHAGEEGLSILSGQKIRHEKLAIIRLQLIERKSKGLNLSYETLEGILYHSRGEGTLDTTGIAEYDLVMLCDKICYTFADINDIQRYSIVKKEDWPQQLLNYFGEDQRERIRTCKTALILESIENGKISFSKKTPAQKFEKLRKFMYTIYNKLDRRAQIKALETTFNYLNKIPEFDQKCIPLIIAIMTDADIHYIQQISKKTPNIKYLENLGFYESIDYIPNNKFDLEKVKENYLNWA